ncbi:unnamed protein product [Rotaria sp. Silwood1]|nr:unnamed protein product [Rotaria sp. Silwood1]CAF3376284.1 unnamed protein product [Rotaria sp. Silwood1]
MFGECSFVNGCNGTILAGNVCEEQHCCIRTVIPASQTCISVNDFDILYNKSRASFLRNVLNFGINAAGICDNCQAKAAFLAVAATMTQNFQTDEATGTDAEFAADDNKYGNTEEGEGSFYRRRGFFGLRGKVMYQRLQTLKPQFQSLTNPELAALVENSIIIASELWKNPNLLNECGGDLYPGQGPSCVFNETHNGSCSADCITGLEDSGAYCGCSGERGLQCPNSPKHVRCCVDTCSQELKMDLGFLLDASRSVLLENYKLQQKFTKDLLRRVNVGYQKTHVGIINYSNKIEVLSWLNKDYELNEKLQRVDSATYFNSGTDTALALKQANIVFSYENGRRQPKEGATPVIFLRRGLDVDGSEYKKKNYGSTNKSMTELISSIHL